MPLGPLATNRLGGYLMGLIIALLALPLANAPELR